MRVSHAQEVDFKWKDVGPDNMGGRTRAMAIKSDGTIFAGSATGGLWTTKVDKSNPYRTNWSQVASFNTAKSPTDNIAMSVSSIAIDPSNEDIIYVSTGELAFKYDIPTYGEISGMNKTVQGYFGFAGLPGQGVYVSTDGGKTFSNKNATWSNIFPETNFSTDNPWVSVQKVVVNGSRTFAATLKGFYFTDDKFATVIQPAETYNIPNIEERDKLSNAVVLDVEIGDNNTVYVATNKYLFISRDNGATFSEWVGDTKFPRIPANDPYANPKSKQRIEIAVAPSNKKIVYAVEIGGGQYLVGVWRSEDSGVTWAQIGPRSSAFDDATSTSWNPTRGNGLANLSLMVDPKDPDHIYMGSAEWREYTKEKGWLNVITTGNEFFPWNPSYVPGGQHIAVAMPGVDSVYYIGTNAEIVRAKQKGFTGGLIFGETEFKPATGNYNTSAVYGASPTLNGEIIANTQNVGVVLKENTATQSFRRVEGRNVRGLGAGLVATSKFNPDHSIVAGATFEILRSLDAGTSFQGFKEENQGPNFGCLPKRLLDGYPTNITPATATYGATPFVLDEVYDPNEPEADKYVNLATAKIESKMVPNGKFTSGQINEPESLVVFNIKSALTYNPKKEQWAFTCSNDVLWRINNPFGSQAGSTDSSTGWLAVADGLELAQGSVRGMPSAITVTGDTSHTVFVGTSDGRLFRFINAHKPCLYLGTVKGSKGQDSAVYSPNPLFKKELILDPTKPAFPGGENARKRWITSLTVKPDDKNTLLVTYGGYDNSGDNDQSESMIFASFNALDAVPEFYPQDNDPSLPYAPVYSAMYNPADPNKWVAFGTEYGVFVADPTKMNKIQEAFPYIEANGGDLPRVPVYQFSHQAYGYADVLGSLVVIFGNETLQVTLADIAQFYTDRINYTEKDVNGNITEVFFSKHTNRFSQRMTQAQYADLATYNEIYNTLLQFLDPNDKNPQRVGENQLVTKSTLAPRKVKEIITGSLTIQFIKNEGALLPANVEGLIGKTYAATYGRGIMSSGIVGTPKTTARPNNDYDVFIANNNLVALYPNPTKDLTTVAVRLVADASVTIEIHGLDGRKVYETTFPNASAGINKYNLDFANYPTGIYVVKTTVHGNGLYQSQSVKVVKDVQD